MVSSSSLVIKVQHDGTLRRFNASIKKNGQLDLDMVSLKTKILSLFDFPADANLKLTYVDEDGDIVTLVDDDDLNDIIWQSLAFLRINVLLNNERSARSKGGPTFMKPSSCGETSQIESSSLTNVQPSQGGSAEFERDGAEEVVTVNDLLMDILPMAFIGLLLPCLFGPSILSMSPIIILIVLIIIELKPKFLYEFIRRTTTDSFSAIDR